MATEAFTASGCVLHGGTARSATVRRHQPLALHNSDRLSLPFINTRKNHILHPKLKSPKPLILIPLFSSSSSSFNHPFETPNPIPNSPPNPPLKTPSIPNSNETLAAIFALSLALSSKIAQIITNTSTNLKSLFLTPTPQQLEFIQYLQDNVVCTVGPLFFAATKNRPSGYLNTPLTVVAAGMAKWLDIYSGVLMVRVLLSWFPNIPWDRQPLSAIRDLCDPYLNLFRNIIPPIFETLDVSPLLAFAVLGTLGSILNSATGAY